MKSSIFVLSAFSALLVGGCASLWEPETPANFDAAVCHERDFNIYFEGAGRQLTPDARDAITSVQDSLRGCQVEHVRIVGLAAAPGPERINMEASHDRAVTVARFMQRRPGWPRDRFEMLAAGEAGALTEEGNVPMRDRAHIRIVAVAPAGAAPTPPPPPPQAAPATPGPTEAAPAEPEPEPEEEDGAPTNGAP